MSKLPQSKGFIFTTWTPLMESVSLKESVSGGGGGGTFLIHTPNLMFELGLEIVIKSGKPLHWYGNLIYLCI